MLMYSTAAIIAGCAIDALFGDPKWFPHIIRGVGALIAALDKLLNKPGAKNKRLRGIITVVSVITVCTAVVFCALFFAYRFSPWLGFGIETFLCWQLIACRALRDESFAVYKDLCAGDIDKAKKDLSMIVGRDTDRLDEAGIVRAAVETVAENTADGCIAPLVYMLVGGAVGGMIYKAINTMDSMIAYKNEKYADFGRAAAKTDDAANFLPARIAARLMIWAAALCRFDANSARRIYLRDRKKHSSPNSAHTEAVCAGALNIRLGGSSYYGGVNVEKPYIGDDVRPAEKSDILRSQKLMASSSGIALALIVIIRAAVICGVMYA